MTKRHILQFSVSSYGAVSDLVCISYMDAVFEVKDMLDDSDFVNADTTTAPKPPSTQTETVWSVNACPSTGTCL